MTPSTARAHTEQQRTVHVEHCMGTVFTIDIRDPGNWDDAIRNVVSWLHEVDRVFSTYRYDSDICRLQRGEISLEAAHRDVAEVLELCADAQVVTGGYFTAMPNGRLDPTGLVKGWAIEHASRQLTAHGTANQAINGGGDMQLVGEAASGTPWTVGISDPRESRRVLTVVSGRDFAVATSGTAERGAHIVDPFTGHPATRAISATVTGPSLTQADAYATALLVMGPAGVRWIADVDGYEALVVAADATCHRSSGWRIPTEVRSD
jgi:FAD:protein FMN transferase